MMSIPLPLISLAPDYVDFGTCLIGHSFSSSVRLVNMSTTTTSWSLEVPKEYHRVIKVKPQGGVLHVTGSNSNERSATLVIKFTPR